MSDSQIQLKISLSEQLNDLLQSRANRLGIPLTQFVKHLILKEVENDEVPTFRASKRTVEKVEKALKEIEKSVDATIFFKKINEG